MTTFQRLFKKGFEEGLYQGMEIQQHILVKKLLERDFTLRQVAELLGRNESDIRRMARTPVPQDVAA